MKFVISIIFIFQSYIYACELCSLQVPTVYVTSDVTYHKDHTSFDIAWQFEESFSNSLHQYDTNENNIFDPEEELLIEESLVEYVSRLRYLTDIEYKHLNKHTKTQFIEIEQMLKLEEKPY